MFTKPVTQAYDLTDATWEIIVMLLVSFLLGWLFHYFWTKDALSISPNARSYKNVTDIIEITENKFKHFTEKDLQIVEGVGPKIEKLLKENNIKTLRDLAVVDKVTLRKVLKKGGERFTNHNPSTWSDQAALALEKKFPELEEYQKLLLKK